MEMFNIFSVFFTHVTKLRQGGFWDIIPLPKLPQNLLGARVKCNNSRAYVRTVILMPFGENEGFLWTFF
jgi:hypothetical protein